MIRWLDWGHSIMTRKVLTGWRWAESGSKHQEEAPKSAQTQRLTTPRGRGISLRIDPGWIMRLCLESMKGHEATKPASWSLSAVLTHGHKLPLPNQPHHPWCSTKTPQIWGGNSQGSEWKKSLCSTRTRLLLGSDSHQRKREGCISSRSLSASQRDSHSDAHRALEAGCWPLGFH